MIDNEEKPVPICYVGLLDEWPDHVYDTGLTFQRNKAKSVPPWAAALFLRHPEFADRRPKVERSEQVSGTRPEKPTDEEDEMRELMVERVPLENMTPVQLTHFAMRNFGVRFDVAATRESMVNEARGLIGTRAKA